ncbi:cytochrome c oxidase subunit II [Noviherbaspirillum saxi]|uniref:Cytochrome c oxidase subunit II n=2 Tax=Noviherbaspirillum saxi TaxID=2320863 RepID=A0A3A3G3F6_9BURK|nr:cytochrome c oxidase subunit II [Noviherbaspirillum saxi]
MFTAAPSLVHGNSQSALDPQGENAQAIAEIAWVLFTGGGVIFAIVLLFLGIALFGVPTWRSALGRRELIIGGGVVFPVVALSALLVYTFSSRAVGKDAREATVRIEVTGELWWWRVRYLDQAGNALAETANEIRIPAGNPVDLLLTSRDVIHSFWVPNLAGKLDMLPGHVNRLRLFADAPGVFRGQCAEYCGAQHAKMAFHVLAETPDSFAAWLEIQKQSAPEPAEPLLLKGRQLFLDNRCGQCHAIRGTPADGTLGPDLTHLGSRISLAAGIVPNNPGTLAAWITGAQSLKPGSRMPSFRQFSSDDLSALTAYLESLR